MGAEIDNEFLSAESATAVGGSGNGKKIKNSSPPFGFFAFSQLSFPVWCVRTRLPGVGSRKD